MRGKKNIILTLLVCEYETVLVMQRKSFCTAVLLNFEK